MLVVVLLAGTAAAFAVTQHLKAEPTPISRTRVDQVFSPVCRCAQRVAQIAFRLPRKGRLELWIVRGDRIVRTLVRGKLFGRGPKHFDWNGRGDGGELLPDGSYAPRVRIRGRTLTLPNAIRLDTVAPRVVAALAPSGRLRYRLSEPAHPLLYANGRRVVRGRRQRLIGELLVPRRFRHVRLTVAAQDLAGNVSRPVAVGSAP